MSGCGVEPATEEEGHSSLLRFLLISTFSSTENKKEKNLTEMTARYNRYTIFLSFDKTLIIKSKPFMEKHRIETIGPKKKKGRKNREYNWYNK